MRFLTLLCIVGLLSGAAPSPSPLQKRLVSVAGRILDEAQISYVYGGYQVGDAAECKVCNDCLAAKTPRPPERLKQCPVCSACSLDCSHFVNKVFEESGAPFPYLDTATMLALSGADLLRRYGLRDVGDDAQLAAAGDLLVYEGHVVMLERRHKPVAAQRAVRGDVVHATGGKSVRGPGEGIQRERFIDLQSFRGSLRRILRHEALVPAPAAAKAEPVPTRSPAPRRPLRPVARRAPNGD